MNSNRSRKVLSTPLFLAFLGLLFSAWNIWDASSIPCMTAGCSLYQTFTVAGFSLWWVGVVAFAMLGIMALLGFVQGGLLFAGLCLGGDCLLLILMGLTAPCLACLLVALLLALCFHFFRCESLNTWRTRGTPSRSWLLLAWSVLFAINLGMVVRAEIVPWDLRTPEDGQPLAVRIFFSPSCGACRQLVLGMPDEEARKVAWSPVAEEKHDFAIILALQKELENSEKSLSEAFTEAEKTPDLTFFELTKPAIAMLQFRLWVNQAHVLMAGEGRMPFVEFHGLPMALLKQPARSTARQTPVRPEALPFDFGSVGSCSGGKTGPDCP